jgi:hypothetical protein
MMPVTPPVSMVNLLTGVEAFANPIQLAAGSTIGGSPVAAGPPSGVATLQIVLGSTLTASTLGATLASGVTYAFQGYLLFSDSSAADGVTFDFGGGTASFSSIQVSGDNIGGPTGAAATASIQETGLTTGQLRWSALGDTGVASIFVDGTVTVTTGGTFVVRFAANSNNANPSVVLYPGSWLILAPLTATAPGPAVPVVLSGGLASALITTTNKPAFTSSLLIFTILPATYYAIDIYIQASNTVNSSGIAWDISDGTATLDFCNFVCDYTLFTGTIVAGPTVARCAVQNASQSIELSAMAVGGGNNPVFMKARGMIYSTAGGTVRLRASQSSTGGTLTISEAWMILTPMKTM